MGPVLCLITDRQRAGGVDALAARVAAAARAGAHLVQVRERDLDGGPLLEVVRRCLDAVAGTRTRVVVNERLDVALAAHAHGVHLRGDSMPASRVREVVPSGFLVGRSVHAAGEAAGVAAAGGLDYLLFGPVFPTSSKPGHPGVGLAVLEEVVRATAIPVLALGGMSWPVLDAVARTGAAGMSGIGLFDTPAPLP